MKKIILSALALSLFGLSSCSSLNKAALSKVDRAAVVSVYIDRNINMAAFASLMGMASIDAQRDELKLTPVRDNLYETVFSYQEYLPFKYQDEKDVIKAKGYSDIDREYQSEDAERYSVVPGYNVIMLQDAPATVRQCFRVLPENTDAVMEFSISYALEKRTSFGGMIGTAKVRAYLNMIMYDRQGEEVMHIRKTGLSDDSFEFALDDFDMSKVNPLLPQANQNAFYEMDQFIKKKLRN